MAKPSAAAKPSVAARPIAVEKGGSVVSFDCGSATRSCAKEAERSEHGERSVKRVSLDYNNNQLAAKARTHAERTAVCKSRRS